jgi:hypothetical protein
MQCLKNYIQIEGCTAPVYAGTPSGLFINKDLPISLNEIDKLADNEQESFLGVWDEVQNSGIKKFVNRVKAGYKELFNVCFLEDDWFCDNKQKLALALLYYLGVELMITKIYSTRINRFTMSFDSNRAKAMREDFQAEFYIQLKDALELIAGPNKKESGDIFSIVETLP